MIAKVKRNLSGMYFRWQNPATNKWENWCFEDLPKDEQDKICKTKDSKFVKGMVEVLAETINRLGDEFDIVSK